MLQESHTGKHRAQSGGSGIEVGVGGGETRARAFSVVSTGGNRPSRVRRFSLAGLDPFSRSRAYSLFLAVRDLALGPLGQVNGDPGVRD